MATDDEAKTTPRRTPRKPVGRPRKRESSAEDNQILLKDDGAGLTERQRELLRILVQEFVLTATPVSSEGLVQKYGLPYSSATVRNEMAELERTGYITHPHTSAGRVPSDLGYRYYVQHLMESPTGLSTTEQHTIQHQFYQIHLELNEWLRLAASVTARTAHNAALVSAPRAYNNRLKYLQLIGVQERWALLVIVTQDSAIKEQMLNLEEPQTQDDLTTISNRLNTLLGNLTWKQIETRIREWPEELAKTVAERIIESLKGLDRAQDAQIYRDGLVNIISQPEFSDIERARKVVQILEESQTITSIIPEVLSGDGKAVQVIIGGENRFEDLRLLSVVLGRYGIDGQVAGVVGIVGPTRMEYGRTISTVQYISQLLSGLITERRGQ
jgi:heat-inducible transcriptional repressor